MMSVDVGVGCYDVDELLKVYLVMRTLLQRLSTAVLSVGLAVSPALAQSYLQGDTSSTYLQSGANSSLLQGGVDREPINILFLIDASYSMKEKFGGTERKMNAAKQVIEQAILRIPPDVSVGLRVFGQSFSEVIQIDCRQTALLVPLGAHNRAGLIQAVRTIQPAGLTPLETALRMCAEEDFNNVAGSKIIILISDGRDTCGGDPCKFISLLPRYGIKLKVDVVGLSLHDKGAQEELHCVAESSGGRYFDANNIGELIQSVSRSVDKAISGKIIVKPKTEVPPANSGASVPSSGAGSTVSPASTSSSSPGASVIPPPVPQN
ncbi:MAG TPA: VWA domain-containing protein [Oculatellaceae cyanobacterium]